MGCVFKKLTLFQNLGVSRCKVLDFLTPTYTNLHLKKPKSVRKFYSLPIDI